LKGIGDHYYEAAVNVYFGREGPTEAPVNVQFLRRMRDIFKYDPAGTPGTYLLVSYEKAR